MNWSESLLQLLLPAACPGCAAPAAGLCPACRSTLRPAPATGPPPGVDWWVSAFVYEGVLRELVGKVKYRGAHAGWAGLGEALAATVAASAGAAELQVVTWPPTTADRRRQRGFDQAELLARRVAGELSLPARCLLRRLPGPAQTGRDRRARAGDGPAFAAAPAARGTRLLLVDDVATTGTTLASAAAALRGAGAVTVAAATAARTPHPALSSGKELPGQAQGPGPDSRF
jgi:predicted amidophosphoribosyltransferase